MNCPKRQITTKQLEGLCKIITENVFHLAVNVLDVCSPSDFSKFPSNTPPKVFIKEHRTPPVQTKSSLLRDEKMALVAMHNPQTRIEENKAVPAQQDTQAHSTQESYQEHVVAASW